MNKMNTNLYTFSLSIIIHPTTFTQVENILTFITCLKFPVMLVLPKFMPRFVIVFIWSHQGPTDAYKSIQVKALKVELSR